MRKTNITAIILAIIMTCSLVNIVYADDTVQILTAIGIAPTVFSNGENEDITRAELAYMAVKASSSDELEAKDTVFVDATKNVLYSGYIQQAVRLGIFSGVSEDTFEPNGGVTISTASKVIIKVLGLDSLAEEMGGYPQGYTTLAMQLELTKGILKEGNLTRYDICRLFYNALLETNVDISYNAEGINVSTLSENGVYLTSRLGYSIYSGEIMEIDKNKNRVTFKVGKNNRKDNNVILTVGETVTFSIAETLDMGDYENVPVVVWVNSDKEIAYATVQNGYSVKYGYLSALNGDYSEDSAYKASAINRMSFIDDEEEYDVSETAVFYYNGVEQAGAEKMGGRFIRAILKDNEIVASYIWNLSADCLAIQNDITQNTISYLKGTDGLAKLRELDAYTKMYVYLNGKRAELADIKPKSVFRYYSDGERMIISVTEKNVVGVLQSMSGESVSIGRTTYNTAAVYYSNDGVSYKRNGMDNGLFKLFGNQVQGFLSPNGNLVYIKIDGENSITDFYGVVCGVEQATLRNETKVSLQQIGTTVEKKIYTVDKRTEYGTGIDIDVLKSKAQAIDGSGVYRFSVNEAGKIKKVTRPTFYAGYGASASMDFTSFYNDSFAYLYINNFAIYFTEAPITVLYEKDGEFCVENVPWSKVQGKSSLGTLNIKFFSENEEATSPELALLSGSVETLISVGVYHGVLTARKQRLGDDGEIKHVITVEALGGKKEYIVTKKTYDGLPQNAFITFQISPLNDDEIYITTVLDWTRHSDNWATSNTAGAGLFKGTVRKYGNNRLILQGTPMEAYYVHPSFNFFVEVNESNTKNRFKSSNANEINVGDTVFYNLYGGEIRGIFVIR